MSRLQAEVRELALSQRASIKSIIFCCIVSQTLSVDQKKIGESVAKSDLSDFVASTKTAL